MEPKRILVNSDEYKTKGVYLFADANDILYLDEAHTQSVTGEELEHFFLLNAVVVTGDAYYTAVQYAPGATSGAKVLAVGEAGETMTFSTGDFADGYTWDGNTEGLEPVEYAFFKLSDDVPDSSVYQNGATIIVSNRDTGETVTYDGTLRTEDCAYENTYQIDTSSEVGAIPAVMVAMPESAFAPGVYVFAMGTQYVSYFSPVSKPTNTEVLNSILDRTITKFSSDRETIGAGAFYCCLNLTDVDLPCTTDVGKYAFMTCTHLVNVNMPNVTKLNACVFSQCVALKTIDLPKVQSIDGVAFGECTALTTLILRSETMVELTSATALSDTPIKSGTGYIYVPAALVDTYKAASNWSTYANQFRALEDYTVDGTITGKLDESKISA
jgi:hypothetical protein